VLPDPELGELAPPSSLAGTVATWLAGGIAAVPGWLTEVTVIVEATDSLVPLAEVMTLRTCC
jgi:hypothetical protein